MAKKWCNKIGMSILLVLCILVGIGNQSVTGMQVRAETQEPSVTVKIGSKKINKKTYTMRKGSSKKLRLLVTPKKSKVKVKYQLSKKNVVSVSKTGVLKAKKAGTVKITIKVSGKEGFQKKLWFKVKVLNKDDSENKKEIPITLTVGGKTFAAKLYDNQTTRELLKKMPMTLSMEELNGNEKYYYFSEDFAAEPQKVSEIHAGDLKLYGSSCLVLFYESFSTSYSYTSLGYVENPEGLAEALGTGNVSVEIAVSNE